MISSVKPNTLRTGTSISFTLLRVFVAVLQKAILPTSNVVQFHLLFELKVSASERG